MGQDACIEESRAPRQDVHPCGHRSGPEKDMQPVPAQDAACPSLWQNRTQGRDHEVRPDQSGRRLAVKGKRNKDVGESSSGLQAATQHLDMLHHLDSRQEATFPRAGGEEGGENSGELYPKWKGVDVGGMEGEEVEEVGRLLSQAEEVAMTMVYTDGSTQLRTVEVRMRGLYVRLPRTCCEGFSL